MKKSFLILMIIAAIGSMSFGLMRDPLYKNLRVLPRNITKPQMDSVMQSFTASLGVKCTFCHVKNEQTNQFDFASDANNHKLIAREMITMTRRINRKYFDVDVTRRNILTSKLEVSCYTCHNGKSHPAVIPPRTAAQQQQQPEPQKDPHAGHKH